MTRRSLLFLIALLYITQTSKAQKTPSQHPKLLVIILIDQLGTDQLAAFRDKFSAHGINRLINGGAFYQNAYYPAGSNYQGSNLATFYTGTYPSTHGIVSDWWYDHLRNKEVSAAYGDLLINGDKAVRFPTSESLLTSTITDELKWMNNGTSRVTSIGFNPNFLVWTGGHNPNYLYQIDSNTGKFNSIPQKNNTDSIPEWAKQFNEKDLLLTYSKREWGPLIDLNRYHQMRFFKEERSETSSFLYPLAIQEGKDAYLPVLHSPYGNKLIRDFAMSQIINDQYGKNDVTDVITLQFTSRSVHGNSDGCFDAETEDMLLRLDEEIADLIKTIDREVGLENTLVITTSISAPSRSVDDNTTYGIPTGIFSGSKASSLLNLFLMAKYGQGKWVMTYHDGQIFLNHKLIEEHKLDLANIKKEASAFLSDMKGIAYAMPISELKTSSSDMSSLRNLKLNYHPLRSGDIVIKLRPGWNEELSGGRKINRNWNTTQLPLIFYGWKVKPQNIYEAVPMINVAPSICSYLNIQFPNGCEGTPLKGVIIR